MTMRILVTRPREDGEQTAAKLAALGHTALLAPLLEPRFHDGAEPALDDVQAILATSANGVRGLIRRTARRDIPVFAVGPQTTEEARAAGFSDVRNADGDSRALAEAVARWTRPEKGALLHVCGADAPGTLVESLARRGFTARRTVLYAVDAVRALPPDARDALNRGAVDAVMFFSPVSAKIFLDVCGGIPTAKLVALCISPATASVLPPGAFAGVRSAAAPNQAALLALVE
jgi:uroporphyrinogen-III synthase